MKQIIGIILVAVAVLVPVKYPALAQDSCASAFDDVRNFTVETFERMSVGDDGAIIWESTDWENIVYRLIGTSEYYLNNCLDAGQSLAEQSEAIARLAELSLLQPPVGGLDVGSDFVPQTALVDLNGDEVDELLLHTQVPYFSQETVYQIRGGLSIAFFDSEDGWQGQVIAPVTSFVTDQTGNHVSFAMVEDNTLSAETASAALGYFPAPTVEVIALGGDQSPLTAITLRSATGSGETKELNILRWDGRIPFVELRIAFDDWCYPGRMLEWDIREDGSVLVPSNSGDGVRQRVLQKMVRRGEWRDPWLAQRIPIGNQDHIPFADQTIRH